MNDVTVELSQLSDVRERYGRQGPHATIIVPLSRPGDVSDDRSTRWNATRADLRRHGADAATIDRLERVVASLPPRGLHALVTADGADAASCWLSDTNHHIKSSTVTVVDELPMLLPVITELRDVEPIVGAIVDRIGAEVFVIDRVDSTHAVTVEGDDEFVHRGAPGGWSQPRFQRRAELTWDRNADIDAAELASQADNAGASLIVITGDERASLFVEQHLASFGRFTVHRVQAGGRHEPSTPERLHRAASDLAQDARNRRIEHSVDRLREELGQRDRAVSGLVNTGRALGEHRVGVLFLDSESNLDRSHANSMAKQALDTGADVIVSHHLDISEGVAALLRAPYSSTPG